jgi:hypothetical protein
LDEVKNMTEKEKEARKALQCLFLAVDQSIAQDVKDKVTAALDEAKQTKYVLEISHWNASRWTPWVLYVEPKDDLEALKTFAQEEFKRFCTNTRFRIITVIWSQE